MYRSWQDRFWSKVLIAAPDECWLWQGGRTVGGYGKFFRIINGIRQHCIASRVAYEIAKGDPTGYLVMHTCDNPPCCNPTHLQLGTDVDNRHDCVAKGRAATGEDQPSHRLTSDQVKYMRDVLFPAGLSNVCIAKQFDVSDITVGKIRRNISWRHL